MGLGPAMRARFAPLGLGGAVAADEARRLVEVTRAGDEDMGEVARDAPPSAKASAAESGSSVWNGSKVMTRCNSPIRRCMASSGSSVPAVASFANVRSAPLACASGLSRRYISTGSRSTAPLTTRAEIAGLDLAARRHRQALIGAS